MKQDEKGGKRSAGEVGSACTPGACWGGLQTPRHMMLEKGGQSD